MWQRHAGNWARARIAERGYWARAGAARFARRAGAVSIKNNARAAAIGSARITFPLVSRLALQSVRDANLLGGPSRQPPGLTPYSLR
jgi:hypothetical protein